MPETNKKQSPIQLQQLKVRGMFKDISPSGFNPPDSMFKSNPQFAFDIKNMRFSPLDGPYLFDVVNEKGNLKLNIEDETTDEYESQKIAGTNYLEIRGVPIGTNIINDELILFTTERQGIPIEIPTENALFMFDNFQMELIDNKLHIWSELIELNNNAKEISSNILVETHIALIDTSNNNIEHIVLTTTKGELRSTIIGNLSDYTYNMIYVKKVTVFYSNNVNPNRELLTSFVGKSYLKSTNENISRKFIKKIFTFGSVLNEIFPNYSNVTEGILDSTPIINYYGFNDLPNMELINGELISDINISNNYNFISNKNFNNTYKYLSYNVENDEIVMVDNNYPEDLPSTNFITIFFNEDTLIESTGYFYEGIVTLVDTGIGIYEFHRINNIGSINPDDDIIVSLHFDIFNFEIVFNTSTQFTFRQVEITMNGITEILENTNLNEVLINSWSISNSINTQIKEGDYPITIKSL